MNNVIVLNFDNQFGRLVREHEVAISSCVSQAIKQTSLQIGAQNFVAAICQRDRIEALAA